MSAPLEPHAAFLELAQIRLDTTDLDGILLRVAELAQQTVPRTTHVSVTLIRDQKPFTAAFTHDDALHLDEAQYDAGHGPCLDVARSSGTATISDMASESRWPAFTSRALDCGVRSSLSVALPGQQPIVGALNLYSSVPGCFDLRSADLALRFADFTAVAIAHRSATNATLAESLRTAMDTRCVVEQAKGVLMAQQRCSEAQAFDVLTKRAHQANRRLDDVAVDIVERTQRDDS